MNNKSNYEDIINLEHPTSLKHPRMSISSRAAQFAPFSALTGYKEAIIESGRQTIEQIEIAEDIKETLNNRLQILLKNKDISIDITITYFKKDPKKEGGEYLTKKAKIKKIDIINKNIYFQDKTIINIDDIIKIDSKLFENTLE